LDWLSQHPVMVARLSSFSKRQSLKNISSVNLFFINGQENPGRPDQKIYILEMDGYSVIVPFVEKKMRFFLKRPFRVRGLPFK
jgi:hypothetical protein